jgi:Ca2+-transporting ATPase
MGYNEATTRTMVFSVLITANIFLTLVNRSFFYPIWTTIRYKNRLVGMIIGITIAITALLIYVPPVPRFFEFTPLNIQQLSLSVGIGCLFVVWYEVIKGIKRLKKA